MRWDETFFAHSKIEPLLWTEDPGDHPLLDDVPGFVIARGRRNGDWGVFTSRRKSKARPVRISVVRGGRRRTLLPVELLA